MAKNRLVTFVAVAFMCGGCAGRLSPVIQLQKADSSLLGVMAVSNRDGFGHACPADGRVFTVRHNVARRGEAQFCLPFGPVEPFLGLAWSDALGNEGFLSVKDAGSPQDAVELNVDSGSPKYLEIGARPAPGDAVRWVEYDFRDTARAFAMRIREAKVVRISSKNIVIDTVPEHGASGSCLVDSSDRVIGVIFASIDLGPGEGVGLAVEIPR